MGPTEDRRSSEIIGPDRFVGPGHKDRARPEVARTGPRPERM
jgi:hypothetical protein